ncbi:MAG: RNase P modulator RnpM [Halanaerobiaceae bacterium]
MAKKIPIRKCVGCGKRKAKKDLIRIVYNKNKDSISIDRNGKKQGRGAYICPDKSCLNRARKENRIKRSLKISIPEEVYNSLMEEIDIMKY